MDTEQEKILCDIEQNTRETAGNLTAIHGELVNLQKCILAAAFHPVANTDDLDAPIAERVEHLLSKLTKEPF